MGVSLPLLLALIAGLVVLIWAAIPLARLWLARDRRRSPWIKSGAHRKKV